MTRDEVLERLEEKIQSSEFFQIEVFDIQFLRAAAELIRQGGWRPIAEAPEEAGLFLGAHDAMGDAGSDGGGARMKVKKHKHYWRLVDQSGNRVADSWSKGMLLDMVNTWQLKDHRILRVVERKEPTDDRG